jgi:hypothetical protein
MSRMLMSAVCALYFIAANLLIPASNPARFSPLPVDPGQTRVILPAPIRISPDHQAYIGADEITFRWQPVVGASRYRFELVREDGDASSKLDVWTWRSEYTVRGLAPGYTYAWCVQAISASGRQGQPCYRFREVTTSEQPIVPPAPDAVFADNGRYKDRVRLYWQATYRTTHYEIDRSSPNLPNPVLAGSSLDIVFEDFEVTAGRQYAYSVRACNQAGCSVPSLPDLGWAGECAYLGKPIPELPNRGATLLPANDLVQLQWSVVGQVREYQYELEPRSAAPAAPDALVIGGSLLNNVDVYVPEPGKYRWRVRALDPTIGCPPGPWSNYSTFHVEEEPKASVSKH